MLAQITKRFLEKTDGKDTNQYLSAFTAAIALFNVGLHFGWVVPSLPKLLEEEQYDISQDEASYITMISSVGHVIGGLGGSFLIDRIGRKRTILSIAIPQFLGFLLIIFSKFGKYWLYAARISGGIAEGASIAIVPAYVAEVTDPEIRGICGICISLFWPIGSILMTVIGWYLDIPNAAMICLIFPVIHLIAFSLMPESPYYCLMQKNTNKAEKSLKILRRKSRVEKELLSLIVDVDRQMSETGHYKDLLTIKANRKAFIIVSFLRFFQQFTGCTAINSYSQVLIAQTTNLSPFLGSMLMQCLGVLMYLTTYFLIERLGRRKLLLTSIIPTFFVLILFSAFFTLKDYTNVNTSGLDWFPLLLILCFVTTFGLGLGVLPTIITSELFSSSIKSKALGLVSIVFAGSIMASIKLYQYTADHISHAVPFYIFSFLTFINIIFTYFFMPETKGKTLEMIQMELRKEKMNL